MTHDSPTTKEAKAKRTVVVANLQSTSSDLSPVALAILASEQAGYISEPHGNEPATSPSSSSSPTSPQSQTTTRSTRGATRRVRRKLSKPNVSIPVPLGSGDIEIESSDTESQNDEECCDDNTAPGAFREGGGSLDDVDIETHDDGARADSGSDDCVNDNNDDNNENILIDSYGGEQAPVVAELVVQSSEPNLTYVAAEVPEALCGIPRSMAVWGISIVGVMVALVVVVMVVVVVLVLGNNDNKNTDNSFQKSSIPQQDDISDSPTMTPTTTTTMTTASLSPSSSTLETLPNTRLPSNQPMMTPTRLPSMMPSMTTMTKLSFLHDMLVGSSVSSPEHLSDPSSPNYQALNWLVGDVKPEVFSSILKNSTAAQAEVKEVVTRYVLALLYYSTKGDFWIDNTWWLSKIDVCLWSGITCGTSTVSLYLQQNSLNGTIPSELFWLPTLQALGLYENELSSSIPTEIGNLSGLKWLSISSCGFTGRIPSEIGRLTSLTLLQISNNELSGSIPTAIGQLSNLKFLWMERNQLTGPIPTELGQLSNLELLMLYANAGLEPFPMELALLCTDYGVDCQF